MQLHHPDTREAQAQEHLADALSRYVDDLMNDGWADVYGPEGVTAISIEAVTANAADDIGKAFHATPVEQLPKFGERLRLMLESSARELVLKAMGVTR